MSNKTQTLTDVSELLTKYGAWIAYVCIGMIGKFGFDVISRKKISLIYVVGTGCMAVFVGFVTSKWFMNNKPEMGAYCVPVLTLVSRDILMFITLIDWQKLLGVIFKVELKDKK